MKEKFSQLKNEIFSFNPALRLFLLAVTLCSFLIAAEYGVTRPVSNAIFVSVFGVGFFPYAWLATVPLNFLIVFLYNRYLPKFGCVRIFFTIVCLVALIHGVSALLLPTYPQISFFHYIWKDIYILLMFKQLWSLIHNTLNTSQAKFIYGFLFGIGGLGSVLGSLVPSFFAVQFGSEKLLWFSLPLYALLFFTYLWAYRQSGFKEEPNWSGQAKTGAFNTVLNSKLLLYILLIVAFMQISIALVDYQFNSFLQTHIPTQDLRTEYCGRMISIINTFSLSFQLLGGFLAIHFLGLKNAHFLVPLFLLFNGAISLFIPTFAVISYAFVAIKATDYSFFSVIREMLYIPLKSDEKFRAKAVIDVFAYRSAKAFASFLLLFLQFFISSKPIFLVSILSVVTFAAWSIVVFLMFREFRPQLESV